METQYRLIEIMPLLHAVLNMLYTVVGSPHNQCMIVYRKLQHCGVDI